MSRKICCIALIAVIAASSVFVSGCSDSSGGSSDAGGTVQAEAAETGTDGADSTAAGGRTTQAEILAPEASGVTVYDSGGASIDASNTSEGYVMVKYDGTASKVKLQITAPDSVQYTYNLAIGEYETFPLVAGSGTYTVDVLENAYDNMYSMICSQTLDVTIDDEFKPFLYPNQYVWFTQDSEAIDYARDLSDQSTDDLNFVENVYNYVIKNISYDTEKAENVTSGYLPDIDETMDTGKGICFDYASLTAAMLRSQGIPTKLQIGYSGEAYHAWISVYLSEAGWVDNIIEFDGDNWSLMDPTLAASNSSNAVKKYVGDGSNYTLKYSY